MPRPWTHSVAPVCVKVFIVQDANCCVPILAGAVIFTHSVELAGADKVPPAFVVTVPEPLVGAAPPGTVQALLVNLVQEPVNVGPDVVNRMFPSVNVVTAVPDVAPVAVTL